MSKKMTKTARTANKIERSSDAVAHDCSLLLSPVVTEKAVGCSEHNQVVFKVRLDADKKSVARAVQELFGVTVLKVNTIRQKGKVKRFRGIKGVRSDYKKAILTLKKGQQIDLSEGVKEN